MNKTFRSNKYFYCKCFQPRKFSRSGFFLPKKRFTQTTGHQRHHYKCKFLPRKTSKTKSFWCKGIFVVKVLQPRRSSPDHVFLFQPRREACIFSSKTSNFWTILILPITCHIFGLILIVLDADEGTQYCRIWVMLYSAILRPFLRHNTAFLQKSISLQVCLSG